jgi:hypothetical protein
LTFLEDRPSTDRTFGSVDIRSTRTEYSGMKRFASALLWALTMWMVGSGAAAILGVPDLLGPAIGITAGLLVGLDPRRAIWPVSRADLPPVF